MHSNHIINVLKAFNFRNLNTLKDVALVGVDGEPVDDRTYLMERIVQLAADLPVTSRSSATLTNAFLNQLWTDLQHPPQSYLGNNFIFRKADGSGNNILWPHLGASGQPYARTVRPTLMQPIARPDPAVVFESLMVRRRFEPHPNSISNVRILGFPPGVGVLLIMFNRFHNHVAKALALIDEGGRFSRILHPHSGSQKITDPEVEYDEALFQTARLITTGLYINIILKDYVRTILNLNRVDSTWDLDPRSEEGKAIFGHQIPEATGNSVSAEFNLIYRWHSCVSQKDEQWTHELFQKLFGDQEPRNIGAFVTALTEWAKTLSPDPVKRDFAGLQRQPNNMYPDEELAKIWTASVSDVAGRYGASHVPAILKTVEVLGVIQSRSWNLASLNEFRSYFKLQPHKKFEDINPDPEIAEQLHRLYGHPDNVEIYPGIVVEAAKEPKVPGSGLCTSFTISRAILSDAVALVRGDRFYTVDYTPANLTNWGFSQADYDTSVNYGCVLYKLVLNALPNSYRSNSIFAHHPLVTPDENRSIQLKLEKAHLYNFDAPTQSPPPQMLKCIEACQQAHHDADAFGLTWDPAVVDPSQRLAKNTQTNTFTLARMLLEIEGLQHSATAMYQEILSELLESESYRMAGSRQVDMVRDVFNIAHARFVTSLFLLPLGRKGPSHGLYNEVDIGSLLSAIYACTSLESGAAHRFVITAKRQSAIQQLAKHIQSEVTEIIKSNGTTRPQSKGELRNFIVQAICKTSKAGFSPEHIVWHQILPLAAISYVNQARNTAESLDYLLGQGQAQLQQVPKLLDSGGAVRRNLPPEVLTREVLSTVTIVDDGRQMELSVGQRLMCMVKQEEAMLTAWGGELSLRAMLSRSALSASLQVLCGLENLRRTPGPTGSLRRLRQGYLTTYLNVEENASCSHPVSMKVDWDER
ncbi:fatty acid oxygenase [Exophiala viscosa]|uniref:Fatty acid oxygenase n=1 Tax=Exophiala viscosa TaxID=2486360 RepID=A0AAN6DMN4_9EURO|nr:fatty acid oxygenase [Exophiala viscosa]